MSEMGLHSSTRYLGTIPCKDLYTISSSLSQRTCYCHLRSSASAICTDWHSTGFTRRDCIWAMQFRSQQTSHTELSATSTTVTGPVRQRLQVGTKDAPVLDHPALMRCLHDSGAGYKYPDLLTSSYLFIYEVIKGDKATISN